MHKHFCTRVVLVSFVLGPRVGVGMVDTACLRQVAGGQREQRHLALESEESRNEKQHRGKSCVLSNGLISVC